MKCNTEDKKLAIILQNKQTIIIFNNNRYTTHHTYNQFTFTQEVCLDCTKNLRL